MALMFVLATLCLAASTTMAQFNPLLFGLGGEEMFEGGAGSYLLYSTLQQQLQRLELGVRSGAIGGCESGVIGPFTPAQRTGSIQFRGQYLTPPSISLAVSDIVTLNPALPLNFQIRPSSVTAQGAQVTFTDNANSIGSAFVSYMVCPSSSAGMGGQNTQG